MMRRLKRSSDLGCGFSFILGENFKRIVRCVECLKYMVMLVFLPINRI